MNEIHPGLQAINTSIKGQKKTIGILGILILICGLILLGITISNTMKEEVVDIANAIGYIVFSLIWIVPGIFMIRAWILGPKTSKIIKLLTVKKENLLGYNFKYIAYQGRYSLKEAIPALHLVLFTKDKLKYNVPIKNTEEKAVEELVSRLVSRIDME